MGNLTPSLLVAADDVPSQAWRNGGGQTRELLTWPSAASCDLRIAVADIAADGPFSSYVGVQRWIAVISGVGIELSFNDVERQLVLGDAPLCFDGAAAPGCRLLNGPTRDLNLMVQSGRGAMRPARSGVAWTEDFAMRGVFAAASGTWAAADESCKVPAMTLLWNSDVHTTTGWTFTFDEPTPLAQAWWLGFTPAD